MAKFTKPDFVKALAKADGLTQVEATKILDSFIKIMTDELTRGNEVRLFKFGNFQIVDRAQRQTTNPQTGVKMTVPAHKAVSFRVSQNLKNAVK